MYQAQLGLAILAVKRKGDACFISPNCQFSITTTNFFAISSEESRSAQERLASRALLEGGGAKLEFTPDGVAEIAQIAAHVNERMENIGARRLHTVMTTLLEEVLFGLPDSGVKTVKVDRSLVESRLKTIADDEDLRRYIL